MPVVHTASVSTCVDGRASTRPELASDRGPVVNTGRGVATAHHGELFQGQIRDGAGALRRCLLSLPCTRLYSRVLFQPDGTDRLAIDPPHKIKTRKVVELVLDHLETPGVGGLATVETNIPEGKGYGSSTADCVAAARAVADAFGQRLADEEVARLVVRAEAASDNTMFDQAVLFAQREGVVLERYARPVPRIEVIGFDTDRDGIVDTLAHQPAVYSPGEIEVFHTLVAALRRAIRTQDARLVGRIATASALINERFLPKPQFSDIHRLAARVGALGIAAAHSGTILGILLDPADPRLARTIDALRAELTAFGAANIFHFHTWASGLRRPSDHPQGA